jgi:hypothetical protein
MLRGILSPFIIKNDVISIPFSAQTCTSTCLFDTARSTLLFTVATSFIKDFVLVG